MIPMVTPFTEDFRLDLDALRHNLRFTIASTASPPATARCSSEERPASTQFS